MSILLLFALIGGVGLFFSSRHHYGNRYLPDEGGQYPSQYYPGIPQVIVVQPQPPMYSPYDGYGGYHFQPRMSFLPLLVLGLLSFFLFLYPDEVAENQRLNNSIDAINETIPVMRHFVSTDEPMENHYYDEPQPEENVTPGGLVTPKPQTIVSVAEPRWVVLLKRYTKGVEEANRLLLRFSQRKIKLVTMTNGEVWAIIDKESNADAKEEVQDWKRRRADWSELKLKPKVIDLSNPVGY